MSTIDLVRIAEEVRDRGAVGVIVGLPRSLSGEEGLAAGRARLYAKALQRHLEVPVRLWDERLTTVSATRKLQQNRVSQRDGRAVVDQLAAVELLQHWLDSRRNSQERRTDQGHHGTGEV